MKFIGFAIIFHLIAFTQAKLFIPRLIKSSVAISTSFLISFNIYSSFDAKAENLPQSSINPVFGLKKERLLACKAMSNCISSSSVESIEKYGRPWSFQGDLDTEFKRLVDIITEDPYLTLVEARELDHYIHAEAKSAVPPTGTDDLEFKFNNIDHIITYRSNSRDVVMLGLQQPLSDGGSNKNRLESIRRKLNVKEMKMSEEAEDYIKQSDRRGLIQIIQDASQPSEINFLDNSVPTNEIDEP